MSEGKLFLIKGESNGIVEIIDETFDKKEASFMVSEYKMAFGKKWVIWYE